MANPFKEGDKRKKVAPGGDKPKPTIDPPAEPVVVEPPAPTPAAEATEVTPVVGKEHLAKFMEPKAEGKTVGFYLSNEANQKLEKLAKQLKCSKSKALDTLIRNVLE